MKKERTKMLDLSFLLLFVLILSNSISISFYFRIVAFFIPVSLITIFYKEQSFRLNHIRILFLTSLISFISQFYTFRRELSISDEYMLLYPVPSIFMNSYSKDLINQEVYEDGSPKNVKY